MSEADELDRIYDTVDEMLLAARFAEVDAMLDALDLDAIPIVEMLAYLTITLTARDELASRARYYDRVRARIMQLDPTRLDGLLVGLGPGAAP